MLRNIDGLFLQLVEKHGWAQIIDESEIERLCTAVIEQNPNLVKQFHAGKTKVFNSLVGKVSKITQNRADMAAVVQVLKEKLSKLHNAKAH
jgi:aspartyl-tRNA(Asn)/glutamyl-tRNA(Gln) amidotransferase subunit B